MAEFYQHEIAKWNVATDDLTLEQEAAYLRVVSMIRLYERPLRLNYRVLSGLWRSNEARAKRILRELVEAGKLTIEDGMIVDEKAVRDASMLRQRRMDKASAGRLGGIESGKVRRNQLKSNDTGEAGASTIEYNRTEEDSTSSSSGSARTRERTQAREEPPPESIPLPVMPPDAWRLYDLVIEAVGLRSCDMLPTRWMPPAAVIECSRFRGLGLNDDEIVAVAKGSRASFSTPPNGPKALERAMANFAAAKAAPQLTPPTPNAITALNAGGYNDRAAEQRRLEQSAIIAAAARGTTARGRT